MVRRNPPRGARRAPFNEKEHYNEIEKRIILDNDSGNYSYNDDNIDKYGGPKTTLVDMNSRVYPLSGLKDAPTILYMYIMKNKITKDIFLKIGISRLPWEKCGKLMGIRTKTIFWHREWVVNNNEVIEEQCQKRINEEKTTFNAEYRFINRKCYKLFPTFTEAKRIEEKLLYSINTLPWSKPEQPIRDKNGNKKTEFFYHPEILGVKILKKFNEYLIMNNLTEFIGKYYINSEQNNPPKQNIKYIQLI